MNKTTIAFRGVSLETRMKCKLLSMALGTPMYQLLELMVDELWEQKKDQLSTIITPQKANKQVRRILRQLRVK